MVDEEVPRKPFPLFFVGQKQKEKMALFHCFIVSKIFAKLDQSPSLNTLLYAWNFILKSDCLNTFGFYLDYYSFFERNRHFLHRNECQS